MPGEAQKIDRMMECFAQRYCELNPGVFTSTGTFTPVLLCKLNVLFAVALVYGDIS